MTDLSCGTTSAEPSPPRSESGRTYPVGFNLERRLLLDEILERAGFAHGGSHVPVGFWCDGAPAVEALETALHGIVHRHSALRAAFVPSTGCSERSRDLQLRNFARTGVFEPGLYQQALVPAADLRVQIAHRRVPPAPGRPADDVLLQAAAEEAETPLDRRVLPLLRATVFSSGSRRHLITVVVSHLVFDGCSVQVLGRELCGMYAACVTGETSTPPPVAAQYPDFALWQHRQVRERVLDRSFAYWIERWAELPSALVRHADLPFARPAATTHDPVIRSVSARLEPEQAALIRRLASERRLTVYVFFRAVLTIVLHHLTRKPRIAFWANLANRQQPMFQHMIGWCANRHALMTDVGSAGTCRDVCAQVAAAVRDARRHQGLPLPALWNRVGRTLVAEDTGIAFDTGLAAERTASPAPLEAVMLPGGRGWMGLDIRVRDEKAGLFVAVTFDSTKFTEDGVGGLFASVLRVAERMALDLDTRVAACSDLVAAQATT